MPKKVLLRIEKKKKTIDLTMFIVYTVDSTEVRSIMIFIKFY